MFFIKSKEFVEIQCRPLISPMGTLSQGIFGRWLMDLCTLSQRIKDTTNREVQSVVVFLQPLFFWFKNFVFIFDCLFLNKITQYFPRLCYAMLCYEQKHNESQNSVATKTDTTQRSLLIQRCRLPCQHLQELDLKTYIKFF